MVDFTHIPSKSGCYLYYDSQNIIIYIGKAKNLKKRVSQYFVKNQEQQKTIELVKHIHRIDFVITDSEVEALLLESRLIKKHKPKYNLVLKENERYAYIKITDEEYPRIITARKKDAKGEYFGPFISGYQRILTLKTLNRVFELKTCIRDCIKPGLQYQIGQCSCPKATGISKSEYAKRIQIVKKVLKGQVKPVIEKLQEEMMFFASKKQYEYAKLRRDQIQAIEQLGEKQKIETHREFDQDIIGCSYDGKQISYFIFRIIQGTIHQKQTYCVIMSEDIQQTHEQFFMQHYDEKIPPKQICISDNINVDVEILSSALSQKTSYTVTFHIPKRGDLAGLVSLAQTNADYLLAKENPQLIELKKVIHLPFIPKNIECYDISNLKNEYIVGAKVHFLDGKPQKNLYRKYKIRWTKTQNDFAAMYEVLIRRFKRVDTEPLPQLIVIDGGKGQLQMALKAAKHVGVHVPMIGLAKQEEEIHFPANIKPLQTNKNNTKNEGIRLLIQIRDETHRFVLAYHKKLRDSQFTK